MPGAVSGFTGFKEVDGYRRYGAASITLPHVLKNKHVILFFYRVRGYKERERERERRKNTKAEITILQMHALACLKNWVAPAFNHNS